MSNISVGETFDDYYSCATCQKKFRKEGFLHRHIRTYVSKIVNLLNYAKVLK